MATHISVRITDNPYKIKAAREAAFRCNGLLNRYQFNSAAHLAHLLVADGVEQAVIDECMASLERLEWEGPYPLFAECADAFYDSMERPPVAEAVTDCDCRDCQCGVNARLCDPLEPPAWQLYVRGVIWCGMLAVPWIAALYLVRLAVSVWRVWA